MVVATRLLLLLAIAGAALAQQRSLSTSTRRRNRLPAGKSEVLDFSCPEDFGYYQHPTDCTQYYVCVFGGALQESCSGGLVYSHDLQTCDWPRNVVCNVDLAAPVSTVRITDPRTAEPPRQRAQGQSLTPSVSNGFAETFRTSAGRSQDQELSGPSSTAVNRQGRIIQGQSGLKQHQPIRERFQVQESTNRAFSVPQTTTRTFSFPGSQQSQSVTPAPVELEPNFYSDLLNLTDDEYFYLYDDLLLEDYFDATATTTTPRSVTRAPIRLNLTDNLLQYEDIDPAPSFSLSSTLHSDLPTSSLTALSNSAAHSASSKLASTKNSASNSIHSNVNVSTEIDGFSDSSLQPSSRSLVSSKFPSLSPFKPVSRLSFPDKIQTPLSPSAESSDVPSVRLKILMPSRSNTTSMKTSASAIIRPEFYDEFALEDDFNQDNAEEESVAPEQSSLPVDLRTPDDSLFVTDRLSNATNSTAISNDPNTNVINDNDDATTGSKVSRDSTKPSETVDNIDVLPPFLSNRTTPAPTKLKLQDDPVTVPLRTNLKPIAQLSPNASFVRILSRHISDAASDVQSIKSVKRLRLRPLTLARPITATTETYKDVPTHSGENTEDNSQTVNTAVSEITISNETDGNTSTVSSGPVGLRSLLPFPKRSRESNKISSATVAIDREVSSTTRASLKEVKPTTSRPKLERLSSLRNSLSAVADSALNVRPSYRLTSRLSSNHPAAMIQSLSSNSNSQNSFTRTRFRTPSFRPISEKSDKEEIIPRIQVKFQPNPISLKGLDSKSSFGRLTNIRREPLTESPNKLSLTTTEPTIITLPVATEAEIEVATEIYDDYEEPFEYYDFAVDETVQEEDSPVVDEAVQEKYRSAVDEMVQEEDSPAVDEPVHEIYSPAGDEPVHEEYSPAVDEPVHEEYSPAVDELVHDEYSPAVDELVHDEYSPVTAASEVVDKIDSESIVIKTTSPEPSINPKINLPFPKRLTTTEFTALEQDSAAVTTTQSTSDTSRSFPQLLKTTSKLISTTTESPTTVITSSRLHDDDVIVSESTTTVKTPAKFSTLRKLSKETVAHSTDSTTKTNQQSKEVTGSLDQESKFSDKNTDSAKAHPLLASLRSRTSPLNEDIPNSDNDNKNINNSHNPSSPADNSSSKLSINKKSFKSTLSLKADSSPTPSVDPLPISGLSNFTISASSSASSPPTPKPSAGRLGHLFPTPRSDVAVSLRTNTKSSSQPQGKVSTDSSRPARLTVKPVSEVLKNTNHLINNVWKYPPRRPASLYPTPLLNSKANKCDPKACRLPDCNCGGKEVPGGLAPQDVPQLVMLTFDDSVNDLNKELYMDLFEKGRTNPNGCPLAATFYVSHEWTDYSQVQNLYADGHEIASHSITHSFGEQFSKLKWAKEIAGQREIMSAYGGVNMEDIRGMRAPFLAVGGNKMFEMLHEQNFTYDSSMPVYENRPPSFPYTLDYKLFHDCMIPPCPTNSFPGLWEVPMVMWQDLNGGRCSMGDACTTPPDAEGVYKMLIMNFERHYTTNRAPMGLFYHAAWFTTAHHKEGFIAFLDTISGMPDVWLVTNWQALQWVRDPIPLSQANSFKPFQCNYPERPARCKSHKVCNVWHKGGVRYMRTCQRCPEAYPWVGATGVDSPLNDI